MCESRRVTPKQRLLAIPRRLNIHCAPSAQARSVAFIHRLSATLTIAHDTHSIWSAEKRRRRRGRAAAAAKSVDGGKVRTANWAARRTSAASIKYLRRLVFVRITACPGESFAQHD